MSEAGKGDEDIGKECKSQSKHGVWWLVQF